MTPERCAQDAALPAGHADASQDDRCDDDQFEARGAGVEVTRAGLRSDQQPGKRGGGAADDEEPELGPLHLDAETRRAAGLPPIA